jgi:hypothetical protein
MKREVKEQEIYNEEDRDDGKMAKKNHKLKYYKR